MKKGIVWLLGIVLLFSIGSERASADDRSKLDQEVSEVMGTPYKWGGTRVSEGFDCSGFILYIFGKFNLDLPRTSKSQASAGDYVAKSDLRPGDLVFFETGGNGISHAGIYVGDNKFAHSSSSNGVTITKLSSGYYKDKYVTARRIASETSYLKMTGN
ncbi:C40 family peptidase [Paenibacillus tritici]|uniref:C40 family peptidase n=1 Tax=Paenibacillus tritici TaxID=1873425 RepID=A0ABX2DU91_9BACL|nr:C40 family peptidase [Paenibacillus tritici]NQX47674.1 C40 family peptidase [Paenibacillus tritici]QUL52302.1 C40 family peptidase [Paenibacillus tritici]